MRAIIIFVVLTFGAHASVLTLQEAIETAKANSPVIAKSELQAQIKQNDFRIAKAQKLPKVDGVLGYEPVRTYLANSPSGFESRDEEAKSAFISLSQPLFDFGKRDDFIKSAHKSLDAAKAQKDASVLKVIFDVSQAYYLAAFAKRNIEAQETFLAYKEALYKETEALFGQGLKTKADALMAKADMLGAQAALNSAKSSYSQALIALMDAMGTMQYEDLDVDAVVLEKEEETKPVDELLKEALAKNPDLKSLNLGIEAAAHAKDAQKKADYPELLFSGRYGYEESIASYESKDLLFSVTIPFYTGGKNEAEYEKSRYGVLLAKEELKKGELDIAKEIKSAWLDIQKLKSDIAAKEATIKSFLEARKIYEGRYREGISTYVEVISAQKSYEESLSQRLELLYRLQTTFALLKMLVGDENF